MATKDQVILTQKYFALGFVYATASVARAGQDTLAHEMLGEIGKTKIKDIRQMELAPYDREPLLRVIRLHRGAR